MSVGNQTLANVFKTLPFIIDSIQADYILTYNYCLLS